MEIHCNNPMYPTELSKLIIANADFPAGKNMLHHAFNNAVIEVCLDIFHLEVHGRTHNYFDMEYINFYFLFSDLQCSDFHFSHYP
jgi:hypothetical protein